MVVDRRGRRGRAAGGNDVPARGYDDGDDAADDNLGTGKDNAARDDDDPASDDAPGGEPAKHDAWDAKRVIPHQVAGAMVHRTCRKPMAWGSSVRLPLKSE